MRRFFSRQSTLIGLLTLALSGLNMGLHHGSHATGNEVPPAASATKADASNSPAVKSFLEHHCVECHDADTRKGDLDLTALSGDFADPLIFNRWVKVYDRVQAGEMPPKKKQRPPEAERADAMNSLEAALRQADLARGRSQGRVVFRRLNRGEYEHTLRDLLTVPNLEVKDLLPEDAETHGFDNVGEALNVSYVQIGRYLDAADSALDAAMVLTPRPEVVTQHLEALTDRNVGGISTRSTEGIALDDAVGMLRQPNSAQGPVTWTGFRPRASGSYHFKFKGYGFSWDGKRADPADRPTVVSFFAVDGFDSRWLATFDLAAAPPGDVVEFTAFIKAGEQLEIHADLLSDNNVPAAPLPHALPGVAMKWLETQGPLIEQWPPVSYVRLFGDLPVETWKKDSGVLPPRPIGAALGPARARDGRQNFVVVSNQPREDARRLLAGFIERAFRRPVAAQEVDRYLSLVNDRLDQKWCFQDAMRVGYKAVLCSPDFLFFHETPGKLDSYALASRLSYFLWDSQPDTPLLSAAADESLLQDKILDEQVERLLNDPRSQRFVESFAGQWLDLRKINFTHPDKDLYPEFDVRLQQSMPMETLAFFSEMAKDDLGASNVIDSDFAMLNQRLAELYGIDGVQGSEIRKVKLPPGSHRGGILTQAAVLKVTANGTTTSPVTRGAWVVRNIMGTIVPPPPPNVPAIDPDVRGATTIREQLARHRNSAACAGCHARIDPPGFALESFDAIGGWRDHYRSLGDGKPVQGKIQGQPATFKCKIGPAVDPTGQMPDGQTFQDIDGLKQILMSQKQQVAQNLVERLLVYSTGGDIGFSDRKEVERILAATAATDYGLRTLIHEVVKSRVFREK